MRAATPVAFTVLTTPGVSGSANPREGACLVPSATAARIARNPDDTAGSREPAPVNLEAPALPGS